MINEFRFEGFSVETNVAVSGVKGMPDLILLHGVTRSWRDFLPILPSLAYRYRVHALDLRGHGRSSRADKYFVLDYVNEVHDYIEKNTRTPVLLLGHSLGGMVAAAVAAASPESIRGLVLEDPPFAMMGERIEETYFADLFRAYRVMLFRDADHATFARRLAEIPIRLPNRKEPVRLGELRDAAALRFAAAMLKQTDRAVLEPLVAREWLFEYDVETTLSSIRCPVLFLQADFDSGGALPDDYASLLASMIADVTFVKSAGIGHQIHWSSPDAMLCRVHAFLESLD